MFINRSLEHPSERRRFYRKLFAMVFPIAFQSFMTAMVNASDAIMLGFLDQPSLSAVSLAGQITFVFNLCITVLTQGTTMLAAQYWGKDERKSVEEILSIASQYALAVALLFSMSTFFCPKLLMRLFTTDERLVQCGSEYLHIVSLSYVPLGLSQVYLCIMKNSGRTKKSTRIASAALLLNILLNALLIFGWGKFPALDVRGAAAATTLAMFFQFAWTLQESRKSIDLQIRLISRVNPQLRRDFNHYTLPIVGNYLFWGGGVTLFSIIIGRMGIDAVAANSIANILRNILSCVAKGVGTAGAILVGNALGRGEIYRAKLFAGRSALLSAILGIISGTIILLLRPLLLEFIPLRPAASDHLSSMLTICAAYIIPGAINNTVIGGVFCAGGKSRFGCICDAVVLWGVVAPAAALAAFCLHLSVPAVYFILCLDEWIKLPIVIVYYRKYTWAQNLTR